MNKKGFSDYCKARTGCTVTEYKAALKWDGMTAEQIKMSVECLRMEYLARGEQGNGEN